MFFPVSIKMMIHVCVYVGVSLISLLFTENLEQKRNRRIFKRKFQWIWIDVKISRKMWLSSSERQYTGTSMPTQIFVCDSIERNCNGTCKCVIVHFPQSFTYVPIHADVVPPSAMQCKQINFFSFLCKETFFFTFWTFFWKVRHCVAQIKRVLYVAEI